MEFIKKTIIVFVLIFILINIIYGVYQIITTVKPYIKLLFQDIKSDKETEGFFTENKEQIQRVVDTLSTLPYDKIIIYDWMLEEDYSVSGDNKYILLDDIVDNHEEFYNFIVKNHIDYIKKDKNNLYIVTDTAIDYEQGIAWICTKNEELISPGNLEIYYKKHLSGKYWFYKARD